MRLAPALIVLLAVTGSGLAAADYGGSNDRLRRNVGIGLGTTLWSKAGNGLLVQVCAATTNGTSGNQTFAITSGTSGADRWDGIVRNEGVHDYISGNLDALARDIAVGSGETIDALADLLEIPSDRRAAFAAGLKANHLLIFSGAEVTAEQVVERIADVAIAV